MILQALAEYYERLSREGGITAEGFERKAIPYVVVLNEEGECISFYSTYESVRQGKGTARKAKKFTVPLAVKRTSGMVSNLLWDTPEYALGLATKKGGKKEKEETIAEKHRLFIQRIERLAEEGYDKRLEALKAFLRKSPAEIAQELAKVNRPVFEEMLNENGKNKSQSVYVSFEFEGDGRLICETETVMNLIASERRKDAGKGERGICLITGEIDEIVRVHPIKIKGVKGGQASGGDIVSFNQDAFTSYNKEQGMNAPCGRKAVLAYASALNHLLSSSQKVFLGGVTFVFWADKKGYEQVESGFSAFFGWDETNGDSSASAIKQMLSSIRIGDVQDVEGRFYVLGLAPNSARLAIKLWMSGSVSEMVDKLRLHFEDLKVKKREWEPEIFPLSRLLRSIAPLEDMDRVSPNLAADIVRSVLSGLPYPATLYQAVLRRIKVLEMEEESSKVSKGHRGISRRKKERVTRERAAIIKAYLNRWARYQKREEVLDVGLDKNNRSVGYRLGRLFAVLEKAQMESSNRDEINASIADRFFASASGTPVTVFPNLIRLSRHHLSKLETGRRINIEKLLSEIMSEIDVFPAHLSLEEQGMFAVGYYHQKLDLYTKKEEDEARRDATETATDNVS